jgi:phage-related protein
MAVMPDSDKPLAWLHGEIKTMPQSRPMPSIGARCHELRIVDGDLTWRIVYRLDRDAVIICEVFSKKTQATPKTVVESCRRRLAAYDGAAGMR